MAWNYNRITLKFSKIRFLLLKKFYKKIIIGAGGKGIKGYLKTEMSYLNVERPFGSGIYEEIIAEHVWEHLSYPKIAIYNCYKALVKGGKLTISVPHPIAETKEEFILWGHKTTFNHNTLTELFVGVGFKNLRKIFALKDKRFYRESPSIIIEGIK